MPAGVVQEVRPRNRLDWWPLKRDRGASEWCVPDQQQESPVCEGEQKAVGPACIRLTEGEGRKLERRAGTRGTGMWESRKNDERMAVSTCRAW